MITRRRLESTQYGRDFLNLLTRLVPVRVKDWGNNDSATKQDNRPEDREVVADIDKANVISSINHRASANGVPHHALVLDIDMPTWLMPSTTPGHYHLYIDVPGGIPHEKWTALMVALRDAGVIEHGYMGASLDRGWSCVRLPWVAKGGDGTTALPAPVSGNSRGSNVWPPGSPIDTSWAANAPTGRVPRHGLGPQGLTGEDIDDLLDDDVLRPEDMFKKEK